ncbi:hypothetical protein LguiB_024997 [Lonicera macranthoides]
MASFSFTHLSSLARWHSNWPFFPSTNVVQVQNLRLRHGYVCAAISKKKNSDSLGEGASEDVVVEKKTTRTKLTPAKSRKKTVVSETPDKVSESVMNVDVTHDEAAIPSGSIEDSKKPRTHGRKKAASPSGSLEELETEKNVTRRRRTKKKVDDAEDQGSNAELSEREGEISVKVTRKRRTKKKVDDTEDQGSDAELSDHEGDFLVASVDDDSEIEIELLKDGDEDNSFTYGWPPLVCCFGAAQHAFVPSGRPANRLVDYEIHERMKDVLWAPEKFIRAPGGCSSNVAVVLASLGGKVAFMGKVGDDDWGHSLLSYLNLYKVQTRSVHVDAKKLTAVSHMKIGKRGGLRTTCVKPCAEDSLSRSEINIDVLKEAKMFYFNTFSLLDQNMRSTAFQAIKISKKLGGVIFYDPNLPLPLWRSSEETKMFIKQFWDLADIIEVTKQELEFLCGIKPFERFDTKDNDRSKFVHYDPEVIAPLWHENLKVLFVTNGSSKIHYYTKAHNGVVRGMEDAPITPFTCDMSATGDGIVAGLMKMLTVQPHLMTNKGYLQRTIKYAIDCGVLEQWKQARKLGFPPKEDMEGYVTPDPNGIKSITEKEYRTLFTENSNLEVPSPLPS